MVSVLKVFPAAEDRGRHKTGAPTVSPLLSLPTSELPQTPHRCPWFGTSCTTTGTGTECGHQVPLLSQAPRGKGPAKSSSLCTGNLGPTYSVLRGRQFTQLARADCRYLFLSPLSEGHLGRVGTTVVKVFTPWKLASTFFFPPGEPAVDHLPAYLCLTRSSTSKNQSPFGYKKNQLFLLDGGDGDCVSLISKDSAQCG